ncbi:MAG TPA: O-antigen ligase family protein, partial [Tepidisphaeraceae bacterium]|nr:O-antigen ligase family protein [Tepidisphaeraceae bacterium]
MSRSAPKHARRSSAHAELMPPASAWEVLTRIAFGLALVLVVARATIAEVVVDAAAPVPGAASVPATAGPATGLVLDLVCLLPALLVLARWALDRRFALGRSWAHGLMLLLAVWTLLSIFWSSNKFAAMVEAAHWVTALSLIWAMSQVVRGWMRLRLVSAVAFGVLLVLLVQGYYYRFLDLPEYQRDWREHRAERLHDRGLEPGSLEAIQMEKNILNGEVMGFSLSRNTYAAELVLLGMIAAGILIQRISDRDERGWLIPIAAGIVLSVPMLYLWVQSKTAYATPVIGAIVLILLGIAGRWIAVHARCVFWGCVAGFGLVFGAVIGHGLKHGSLFQQSLTFRWYYWVGAMRVFVHHPWLGVGWANFGPHYLAHRLARAVEEPRDPHNFLIRALVELGIIGGLLMLGWMLRLWWELTQNRAAVEQRKSPVRGPRATLILVVGIALAAMLVNVIASIDFTQSGSWVFIELFKRGIFLLALIVGICTVAIRSTERQELDDRPAPWILRALLVGIGLFLIHNLIDFSMFEPGPMFLLALLMGAALGMRLKDKPKVEQNRALPRVALAAACVAWLLAAAGAWRVALAESIAQDADYHIRSNNPRAALAELMDAFKLLPI